MIHNSIFQKLLLSMCLLIGSQIAHAQCTFNISTSGENSAFIQLLILAETDGTIIDIINGNNGTFTTASTGSYNVHALNYDPLDPPNPLPMIGDVITGVGSVSGCFNSNLVNDIKPLECLCGAEPVMASFNALPGYEVIYVLADATGLILSTNTTGTFVPTDGIDDNTFVHALHYEIANPPSPLPMVGGNVSDVGTTSTGCFNSEFTTNPLCIAFSPGGSIIPIEIVRVCDGNALFASLDGTTPINGTGLIFVWYLDGQVVGTTVGIPYFSPNMIGDTYTVSAVDGGNCTTYVGETPFIVTEIIDCKGCGN